MQVLSFNDHPLDFLFGDIMLERLELLVNKEKLDKLKEKTIMIVGLGGVGGYVVESLVRCGIGNFILIDYDTITISNKNRQIIALDSNIGKKKTECFKERILDINKECNVTCLDLFLDKSNTYDIINKYKPSYVIDCCDSVEAKKEIIKTCIELNINFISSMGTGNKFDITKLKIMDIRKTEYDPLAKIIRRWVKDEKIKEKIDVLISSEPPIKTGSRIVGSNSFVPCAAGLLIGSHVFKKLIDMV